MSELKLEAQPRNLTGRKVRQLRRQGLVPVVVYGNVKDPVNLQVDGRSLERMLHAGGNTRVVELNVEGGDRHNVLVKEVHREPIHHALLHADLFAVNMLEKQHVSVPLVNEGRPASLVAGQMVLQLQEAVNIEALPADIPAEITIDITELTLEQPITIADLPALPGVAYLDDPEEILVSMIHTKEQLEDEEVEEGEEIEEPEVVGRGRDEEDEERKGSVPPALLTNRPFTMRPVFILAGSG